MPYIEKLTDAKSVRGDSDTSMTNHITKHPCDE